jgi:hypothetical protein
MFRDKLEFETNRQHDVSGTASHVYRRKEIIVQTVRIEAIIQDLVHIGEIDKFSLIPVSQTAADIHSLSVYFGVFVRVAEVAESAPDHNGIELQFTTQSDIDGTFINIADGIVQFVKIVS